MNRVCRRQLHTGKLVLVILLFCPISLAAANHREEVKTQFGSGIKVARGLHRFHTTCMLFSVYFISDQFFHGLQVRRTEHGVEFTKKKTKFQTFPDHLIVEVEAHVFKCPMRADRIPDPAFGETLMSDPEFDLRWRDSSGKIEPIAVTSVQQEHNYLVWNYFLEVSAKDVSLSDAMLLQISLRRNTTNYQMSASLVE